MDLIDRLPLEVAEDEDLADRGRCDFAGGIDMHDVLARAERAATQTTDGDLADIRTVLQGRDQQLQGSVDRDLRRRYMPYDGVEKWPQVGGQPFGGQPGAALQCAGVDDGKIGLVVACVQIDEEVKGCIEDLGGSSGRTGELVDHHHGLVAALQCLAKDETGLRHRPFDRVDKQHDTINHIHYAFDFAAKISMPRRIDDIYRGGAVENTGIFRQNRNPALALEVI